ncbi:hypothetical protein BV25DRAFT_1994987 [Artomyces pyxidatus]|uniref:Uncharacterized protein n=1 Tax=Artomyces pyxidatus TaxID=48021 RepID=A0ACB8SLH2_9AGAM|nr:hypothetical protein BV25DRAFT_1994987 [Artomyces pyxidatus]
MSSVAPAPSSSFFDFLKPRYHEAVFRLKQSVVALLALITLTHLLPLPTLYSSAWKFYRSSFRSGWEKGVASVELFLLAVLLVNILQASYAIRSPRAPFPPLASPARPLNAPKGLHMSPPTPSWRNKAHGLSPNTTPQRQLPFSASVSSDPRNLAHSYSLSFPTPSPDASFNSTMSLPPSPSPSSPLAAYRGRRGVGTGRALDGSLLARLSQVDSDDDE